MNARWKPWISRLELLAAIALASAAIATLTHHEPPPPTAATGATPTLALQTLDGKPLDAHALAGHVVVLNFWATWCPACRGELPDLVRFADAHRGDCVRLLGVTDEDAAAVAPFARAHGLDYPLAVGGAALEQQLGVEVIPTSVILGPDGRIAGRIEGAVTPADLDQLIKPLLHAGSC